MNFKKVYGLLKNNRGSIFICVLLFTFSFTFYFANSVPIFFSQDEMCAYYSAQSLINEGNVQLDTPLNKEYNTNIFIPAIGAYKTSSEIYLKSFPGTTIFLAIILILLGDASFYLIPNFFASFCIVLIYLIGLKLFKSKPTAALAAIILSLTPIFVQWSVNYYNNIPTLFFVLSAFLFFIYGLDKEKQIFLFVSGVLLAIAIFLRLPQIFLLIPFIAYFYFKARVCTRETHQLLIENKKMLFAFLLPIALMLFVFIPLSNTYLYQDPLFFPHLSPSYRSMQETPTASLAQTNEWAYRILLFFTGTKTELSEFSLGNMTENLFFHFNYFITSIFAFPLLCIALLGIFMVVIKKPKGRPLVIFLFLLFFCLLIFYGKQSGNYYGFGKEQIRVSFFRYLLPVYAFLSLFASYFLVQITKPFNKNVRVSTFSLIILLIVATSLCFSYSEDYYGLNKLNAYRKDVGDERGTIQEMIKPDKSIVITGYYTDKLVYSGRNNNIIYYHRIPKCYWPEISKTVDKILLNNEYPVFFISTDFYDKDIQLKEFLEQQFKITLIESINDIEVYSVKES